MEPQKNLNSEYWSRQYQSGQLGWDIGYPSPALKAYLDQLLNKNLRILLPGAGKGWEAGYAFRTGFNHVYYLDFSPFAVEAFKNTFPDFPEKNILCDNFFSLNDSFDLIIEQTFFSSLSRNKRIDWITKCYNLLSTGGKMAGLLFNHEFVFDGPPFGGTSKEYLELFNPGFEILTFETAYNSIKPRAEREIFFIVRKK